MGDVFDRIVSRAAMAPDRPPAAGLTTRRWPVFGVPDAGAGATDRVSGSLDAGLNDIEVELVASKGDHSVPQTRSVESQAPRDTSGSGRRPASSAIPPQPQVGGRGRDNEPEQDSEPSTHGVPRSGPEGTAPGEPPVDAVAADVAIGVKASDARTPVSRPARADLRARPRPPRPDPTAPTPPTRTVAAEELLREHLAPAVVDHGSLNAEDAARLSAVGLEPIEVPTGGDVHVHIGHVVVQQAPTPPVPEPPRPANRDADRSDRVDPHADYLARQRRRWS